MWSITMNMRIKELLEESYLDLAELGLSHERIKLRFQSPKYPLLTNPVTKEEHRILEWLRLKAQQKQILNKKLGS
jgi:hypothetical protein